MHQGPISKAQMCVHHINLQIRLPCTSLKPISSCSSAIPLAPAQISVKSQTKPAR